MARWATPTLHVVPNRFEVRWGEVQVAGLLDLLRIADASPDRTPGAMALAYRAVLDVQHAQAEARRADGRTGEERIQAWLSEQIPIPLA